MEEYTQWHCHFYYTHWTYNATCDGGIESDRRQHVCSFGYSDCDALDEAAVTGGKVRVQISKDMHRHWPGWERNLTFRRHGSVMAEVDTANMTLRILCHSLRPPDNNVYTIRKTVSNAK